MDVNLVFEGGGVLGVYYVGAYKALREFGYRASKCAGTSAGSIISSVIIAGYTPRELEDIVYETDFNAINKKTKLSKIPLIGKPLSLIYNKGMYDIEAIEQWIENLLRSKGITKFKDVMSNGESRLKITAADITRSKLIILPDDLYEYGIDPQEFSVAKAAAMSSSIPYYFTPIRLKHAGKTGYIVDGGLLSGFPVWVFDNEETPTIGIMIKNLDSNTSQGKTDIISYTKDVINAPINEDETNFVCGKDLVRTIVIDYTGMIDATSFDKINERKKEMIRVGYDSTVKFLDGYHTNKR